MRVLLLSDLNSPHTVKWVTSLAKKDIEVGIFGIPKCEHNLYPQAGQVEIRSLGLDPTEVQESRPWIAKVVYLKAVPEVRRFIDSFAPDLLHAHFLTSYGLLGALSGFHPYVVSAWGSDMMVRAKSSILYRLIVRHTLRRADRVLATSRALAWEVGRHSKKEVIVTPFGIDLEVFQPRKVENGPFNTGDIVIGTVKALHEHYGVDRLIRSFALLKARHSELPLRLLIVGGGPVGSELRSLALRLGLGHSVVFAGAVGYDDIVRYHNMLSVFSALSNTESFGVSVLESSACEKPVVVSDVGGLSETVEDDVTGFVVPAGNTELATQALERLVLDENLRGRMGKAGRTRVERYFDWSDSVRQVMRIYEQVVEEAGLQ